MWDAFLTDWDLTFFHNSLLVFFTCLFMWWRMASLYRGFRRYAKTLFTMIFCKEQCLVDILLGHCSTCCRTLPWFPQRAGLVVACSCGRLRSLYWPRAKSTVAASVPLSACCHQCGMTVICPGKLHRRWHNWACALEPLRHGGILLIYGHLLSSTQGIVQRFGGFAIIGKCCCHDIFFTPL